MSRHAALRRERRRQQLAVLDDVGAIPGDVGRARIAVRQDVAGAKQVEDLRHQRPIGDTADVAHHLGRHAGHLARLDRALERLGAVLAITFSLIRTLTPSTMSAFSATVRAAASGWAYSML
jgi:hypothetical protein